MKKYQWEKLMNNEVLKGNDFYISYNSDTTSTHNVFTELGNALGSFVGESFKDGEETALCKDGKFYILDGDHRKEYERVIDKGFEECLKYFKSKPELLNNWTTK